VVADRKVESLRLRRVAPTVVIAKAGVEQLLAVLRDAGYAPVAMLRAIHHAPGRLIFPSIAPGTPIEVTGVGRRPLRFAIPDVPAEVVTASGDKPTSRTGPPLRHELRSVHIDADGGHVLLAYGYTTTYRRDFAPEWLRVLPPRAPG